MPNKLCLACIFCGFVDLAQAADSAVILLYHHVSESTPLSTSVTPEQFSAQLDYLEENGFSVLPLFQVLDSVKSGQNLPEKSVVISFDDAHRSIYEVAFPMLKQRNWPFSLFVSSVSKDMNYSAYMTWEELAEMRDYGAEIGGHSETHAHLARRLDSESESAWLAKVVSEIDQGNQRIEEELNIKVRAFAYPYGEYTDAIKNLVGERGLYGLAQQSGAIGPYTELVQIPRYPIAGSYASLERFSLAVNSLPLPVSRIDAGEKIRTAGQNPGVLDFYLGAGDYDSDNLGCYSSNGNRLDVRVHYPRVAVQLESFVPGRNKVNCTAPSKSQSGVYYWYSEQWLVKSTSGAWPPE